MENQIFFIDLVDWTWIVSDHMLILDLPIATKNGKVLKLVNGCGFIHLKEFNTARYVYIKTDPFLLECKSYSDFNLIKSGLINFGWKINWENFQKVLNLFAKHEK